MEIPDADSTSSPDETSVKHLSSSEGNSSSLSRNDSGIDECQISDSDCTKSLISQPSDDISIDSELYSSTQSHELSAITDMDSSSNHEFSDACSNLHMSNEVNIDDASMHEIDTDNLENTSIKLNFISTGETSSGIRDLDSDSSSEKFSTPKSDASDKEKEPCPTSSSVNDEYICILRRFSLPPENENDVPDLENQTSSDDENTNSDSDNSDDENIDDDNDEDIEEKYKFMLGCDSLIDPWNSCKQLYGRETGKINHNTFIKNTSGSLSLVRRLKLDCKLKYHKGCVNALNFNKAGTLLASGADDLTIAIWQLNQRKPVIMYESGHSENVFQSKFMPYSGDSHVVSCARDGQVRLAQLSVTDVCRNTKKLAQHKGAAHKLALIDDSAHTFYSCGEDAAVFEIDIRKDKAQKLVVVKKDKKSRVELYSIHANSFKPYEFCVGGRDQYVRIFDKRMIKTIDDPAMKKFCPHHVEDTFEPHLTSCVYNYDGSEILASYNDESIYLFDASHSDGADYIHCYQGHRNSATIKGVNFYGPKSEYIVSGSDCGHLFMWEKESECIIQFLSGDVQGVVNVLEPHPHYPILATAGLDHDIKIWMPNAPSDNKLANLKKIVKKNMKEKENHPCNGVLFSLMRSLRGSLHRGYGTDEDGSSPGSNSDTDSNFSDDERNPNPCPPS